MTTSELFGWYWMHNIFGQPIKVNQASARVVVEPIPLTADILKVNGWEKDTTNSVSKRFLTSQDTYLDITYYEKDNVLIVIEWLGEMQVTRFCNKIRFVHKLQQTFRLCGIGELADNFHV